MGTGQEDYSILDMPEVVSLVFYPRRDFTKAPPNASDHFIAVDKDTSVSCRFYVHGQDSPSIIYFHGNGETVSDYDYIAPMYNRLGINLFVAEYRGYGRSQGMPTFSNTIADAPVIFQGFMDLLARDHYSGDVFVMGRSLGSISAIEIAYRHQEQLKGLIVESGFGSVFRFLSRAGLAARDLGMEDIDFPNLGKVRAITIPTLIIHGEYDSLVPPSEGEDLFRNSAARDKRLVIIPQANHNDIMLVGMKQYLEAIRGFVLA